MASTKYVFLRDQDTKQVHIYQSQKNDYRAWKPEKISECRQRFSTDGKPDPIEYNEYSKLISYDEDRARRHCPEYGRALCGVCVSTLYGDLE